MSGLCKGISSLVDHVNCIFSPKFLSTVSPTQSGQYNISTLIKKKILIYKEIQIGAVAKSYMRKGFLIYEEMRIYLTKF
jgi:hypothetical protein